MSYFSAWKFIFKGHFIFQEGYQKVRAISPLIAPNLNARFSSKA
jgi:hypothetical protein